MHIGCRILISEISNLYTFSGKRPNINTIGEHGRTNGTHSRRTFFACVVRPYLCQIIMVGTVRIYAVSVGLQLAHLNRGFKRI